MAISSKNKCECSVHILRSPWSILYHHRVHLLLSWSNDKFVSRESYNWMENVNFFANCHFFYPGYVDDVESKYRKSSIRSRPCIILDPTFYRLVLEVLKKVRNLEQKFFSGMTKGSIRTQKYQKIKFLMYSKGIIRLYCSTSNTLDLN